MPLIALSAGGLLLSLATLSLLRPRIAPPWRWAWQGIALHAGLWFAIHSMLVVFLGRPWFSLAIGLAAIMLIVQVSNAKYHALREPFVFQDFEYFTDAIRHPRLYIPFLGWWKFAMIALTVIAALAVGLFLENVPPDRFGMAGQLGEVLRLAVLAGLLLYAARAGCRLSFDPQQDLARLGLLGSLWSYARAERDALHLPDRFVGRQPGEGTTPDIVVVQSESFFDPRPLFPGICPGVLRAFDAIKEEALRHGRLNVPAWGANTVRSEFAFLSGAEEATLGVHRFNPYRKILSSEVTTLASVLRGAGYRTVCIHPYPASFYMRDRVYPHLGFDEFMDIRAFSGAQRFGPYIADEEVTGKVRELLDAATQPLFVFVITMENHGPLHLEKPAPDDVGELYRDAPPSGCEDLTVYLRHLRNADRMIAELRDLLKSHPRPARLCWYGDHVPIMASVYARLGEPDGLTEYFLWSNAAGCADQARPMALDGLSVALLDTLAQ
jgi:hypothetical protein